jgi:hypothetical protein
MTIVMMKQTEGKEWVGPKGKKETEEKERKGEGEREILGWGWRFRSLLFAV